MCSVPQGTKQISTDYRECNKRNVKFTFKSFINAKIVLKHSKQEKKKKKKGGSQIAYIKTISSFV